MLQLMSTVILLCFNSDSNIERGDICREEFVQRRVTPVPICTITMAEIAEWKLHSEFKDVKWEIKSITCHKGEYTLKEFL